MRKLHNDIKREHILQVASEGQHVLDVGCGFGGDLQKWRQAGVHLSMCDPDNGALEEAKTRAKNLKMHVTFYHGDIHACPVRRWDIICYNFSLHYAFESEKTFKSTMAEIKKRLRQGGVLMGVIPDSERILFQTPYQDGDGNFFKMKSHGSGGFGEKLFVCLADTPFYDDGPRSEPVAYKDVLVTHLENHGFTMVQWEKLYGTPITEMYSKFMFVYKKG